MHVCAVPLVHQNREGGDWGRSQAMLGNRSTCLRCIGVIDLTRHSVDTYFVGVVVGNCEVFGKVHLENNRSAVVIV